MLDLLVRLICLKATKTYDCTVMFGFCFAQCEILFLAWKQISPCDANDSEWIGRQTESRQLLIQISSQQLLHTWLTSEHITSPHGENGSRPQRPLYPTNYWLNNNITDSQNIKLYYYGFQCHGDLLYNYTKILDQTRIYLSTI